MPYEKSTLISRTGYSSAMGQVEVQGGQYVKAVPLSDYSLSDPAVLAVGALAAYFLFFRKKR